MADESPRLQVKNWREFQHYNKRRPPWIKLQRSLLDDFEFACLPDASAALAPRIWLLASESDDGSIPADLDWIAFRVHKPREWVLRALKPLIDQGFIQDASDVLAQCYQNSVPEGEGEGEGETEKDSVSPSDTTETNGKRVLADLFPARVEAGSAPSTSAPPEPASASNTESRFDEFWAAYPSIRKREKKRALEIWKRKRLDAKADEIIADVERRKARDPQWTKEGGQYVPMPTTYLNGERWDDELPEEATTVNESGRRETLQPDTQGRLPWLADGSRNPDYRGGTYWQ